MGNDWRMNGGYELRRIAHLERLIGHAEQLLARLERVSESMAHDPEFSQVRSGMLAYRKELALTHQEALGAGSDLSHDSHARVPRTPRASRPACEGSA